LRLFVHADQIANNETPRQAVSVREAAHLLSISPRTVAQIYGFEGHSDCSGRAARSRPDEECERGRKQRNFVQAQSKADRMSKEVELRLERGIPTELEFRHTYGGHSQT